MFKIRPKYLFKIVKPIQQQLKRTKFLELYEESQIQNRIRFCCDKGKMEEAQYNFEKLPKNFRDVVVYNQMINGFCKLNQIENALKYFKKNEK